MSTYTIVAFYKFTPLSDLAELQADLKKHCTELGILGSILLAPEGINGMLAGSEVAIQNILSALQTIPGLIDLSANGKFSQAKRLPFRKTKILIKKEIVGLGMPEIDPNKRTGIEVAAQDWNDLISDPTVVLIDTRNQYEVELGTFQNAIDPQTENFRDFSSFVESQLDPSQHKKIAMFCTGGIRCEKASAYLLEKGFENVYQLQGGILKYLEKIPTEKSLWQGECFVFDERITIEKETIIPT